MLIDCSYFTKGSRYILNASLGTRPDPNAEIVNEAIESYIAESQEEYLKRMLGSTIGNKIHCYLISIEEDDNPKRNANFDAVCGRLCDSFADYVFYRIIRESNTQATITGLVKLKCANEYVSPISRQVSTWNAMVKKNKEFAEWANSTECPLSGITIAQSMLTNINSLNL